jgi:hypothetical protein
MTCKGSADVKNTITGTPDDGELLTELPDQPAVL